MLGHVVTRYLTEQGCEVVTSNVRYEAQARDPLIEAVRDSGCEWIINAIGRIKQKCESPAELFLANSILPLHLKSRLRDDQHLIHAGTDCVFSGKRGSYRVDDERDAEDTYGLSKILAESVASDSRCVVIRTSMIGPELNGSYGLMSWFLRQDGEVEGYVNHRWNGITTLEWAKVCFEIMTAGDSQRSVIVQPGIEPTVSKYELLALISRIWEKDHGLKPVNAPTSIDRTLVPTSLRPSLAEQLAEMKEWYRR